MSFSDKAEALMEGVRKVKDAQDEAWGEGVVNNRAVVNQDLETFGDKMATGAGLDSVTARRVATYLSDTGLVYLALGFSPAESDNKTMESTR
ncbi:MAG: hypothetical protein M3Q79_03905 [bacterium]|nr:hypothetical protein [bacterium]